MSHSLLSAGPLVVRFLNVVPQPCVVRQLRVICELSVISDVVLISDLAHKHSEPRESRTCELVKLSVHNHLRLANVV